MNALEIDELCKQKIVDHEIANLELEERLAQYHDYATALYQAGYLKRVTELFDRRFVADQIDTGYSNAGLDIQKGQLRAYDVPTEALPYVRECLPGITIVER